MSSTPVDLTEALARIVRGDWLEFSGALVDFGGPATVGDTKASLRCHFIRSDPNGRARVDAVAELLADQVVHFCIPRGEIERVRVLPFDRQVTEISRLSREAAGLFTESQVTTGEGAELLLYAMVEQQLRIPQILSKMSLKTSTEMQYHGADGVHARFEGDVLALYWGEAKLYESVSDAMSDCLDSIEPYLVGRAHEQDVFLVKHHMDLGSADLQAAVLRYFDNRSEESAMVEMRGACLIGFTHGEYPQLPAELEQVQSALEVQLGAWRRSLDSRIRRRGLESFVIEVFFVPVPSVKDFRSAVKRALSIPVVNT